MPASDRHVYTVTGLCVEATAALQGALPSVWLEGELSGVKRHGASGHWYFSVKDDTSALACTLWRAKAARLALTPREGLRVVMRGRVGIYAAQGRFQFDVDHLEEAGEGALLRRFEALKAALAAEGLFDASAKREPPALPRRIGVITSPSGAAIRDILHVLRRRCPSVPVLIYPVPVQGAAAAPDIAKALMLASARAEVDVILLARGGGSIEDLWAFNEEVVARAIRACAIPVIAGVGHETDTTIADFAADVRAPTPSGAAELAVPDQAEWRRALAALAQRLGGSARRQVRQRGERLGFHERRLERSDPRLRIRERNQRLDELDLRLGQALARRHDHEANRLAYLQRRLDQAHPREQIRERQERLQEQAQRLERSLRLRLQRQDERSLALAGRLEQASPARQLRSHRDAIAARAERLQRALSRRLDSLGARLGAAARTLQVVSPLGTLERGYAIVSDAEGRVVRRSADVDTGATIEARVGRGRIRAVVSERLE